MYKKAVLLLVFVNVLSGFSFKPQVEDSLRTFKVVTATAYTSEVEQTDGTPFLAAWNNQLEPGMKAIAVSRDLLTEGLTDKTEVTIEGLDGTYVVLDKMNKRWVNRIDIYFGLDTEAAIDWGIKEVKISWLKK